MEKWGSPHRKQGPSWRQECKEGHDEWRWKNGEVALDESESWIELIGGRRKLGLSNHLGVASAMSFYSGIKKKGFTPLWVYFQMCKSSFPYLLHINPQMRKKKVCSIKKGNFRTKPSITYLSAHTFPPVVAPMIFDYKHSKATAGMKPFV